MKTVRLKEICELIRGSGLSKNELTDIGVGAVHYGEIYTKYNTNSTDKTFSFVTPEKAKGLKTVNKGDIILTVTSENMEDVLTPLVWLGEEDIVVGGHTVILKHKQNPKYLAHYFQSDLIDKAKRKIARGVKVIEVSLKDLANVEILLPTLEEQNKIVSILDNIENLISLLEKELDLRKEQFKYYLIHIFNQLRKSSPIVQLIKLLDYEQPTKYQVKSANYDNAFKIPVLTAGDTFILGYTDEIEGIYNSNSNNPVIIFDDFTTGFHWVDFPFKVKSSAMKILKLNSNLNNDRNILRFLYFAMKDLNFIPTQHQRHWIGKYSKLSVPFPNRETILNVVNSLNHFTDYISLLEQEIKLRQKQLQYYRNKLLTE